MNTNVPCPLCGEDVDVDLERVGGDWVPYGSTYARLPSGLEINGYEHDCPGLTAAHREQLEQRAIDQAEEHAAYGGDDDPYGGDGPDD